jgi:cytochrome c-type biogenesis protein CcmH
VKRLLGLLLLVSLLAPAWGVASPPAALNTDDPELDARLNHLAADLRCVVCQNESLAESRASLAIDLREEIRAMMRAGMSDEAVVESLVARYGDFVLYRPPVKPLTYALWGGPLFFLLLGLALAIAALQRRRTTSPQDAVSPDALREAARLLAADPSVPVVEAAADHADSSPRPPSKTKR